jgi:uncharacterized protein (TIGR02246 family)
MKRYFTALLAVTVLLAGCREKRESLKEEEKAIQAAMEQYQAAFNRQDVDKLASLWAPHAIYSNPVTGEVAEGREAIAKLIKDKFENGKERKIEFVHKKVQFVAPDEAVEEGLFKIDVADKAAKQVAFKMTFVKEKGQWLIDEINQIDIEAAPSNFEHLKELTWLVGRWKDSDDNVDIRFDTDWDKFKNFLTQRFKMDIYGQEGLEGKQIIAWDPVKNQVRSWVFDSDGGFGEGTWKRVDKSWHADMKYTLGDGGIATVEREIDGEILPNMDPVTVRREP